MHARKPILLTSLYLGLVFFFLLPFSVQGDDRRAPKPKFTPDATKGIFFDSLGKAIPNGRPKLTDLRKTKSIIIAAGPTGAEQPDGQASGPWDGLITAASIEDEIKRVKLRYDSVVTQPGPFKSGGYQDARLNLMVMSSLFAVITEYNGDVRWKKDAAVARDRLGRTAFNCNAGSTQVFNEAKTRKEDLQDLMSGTGLRTGKSEGSNDWASIADRSPMMEYAEELRESLRTATSNADAIKSDPNDVRRPAELLAVLGKILTKEGMDEYDDPDYVALSEAMTKAAQDVTRGLELKDYDAVRKAVGAVTQSCDACHEQYR